MFIVLKGSWHDDVIQWKHFSRYWPFVRGIHRSPVNSPHKGLWRWALMFSLICTQINGWVNNGEAGDLRRHRAYCDAIIMVFKFGIMERNFVLILAFIRVFIHYPNFTKHISSQIFYTKSFVTPYSIGVISKLSDSNTNQAHVFHILCNWLAMRGFSINIYRYEVWKSENKSNHH